MKNFPVLLIVSLLFFLTSGCSNNPTTSKDMENPQAATNDTTENQTVISKDGTVIAYEKTGQGPYVIVVNGALSHRKSPGIHELATSLGQNFTVITYDRRGRGESADTKPYSTDREIEDIEALITELGGSAYVYGSSSGAALSLLAAEKLGTVKIAKPAMYEPPYGAASDSAYTAEKTKINELLSANKAADAVELFMKNRGTQPDQMEAMKQSPEWGDMVRVGPTLVYDFEVLGDGKIPVDKATKISVPTMIIVGEKSFDFMQATADSLAKNIPGAVRKTLPGQTHQASAEVIVPVLREFFRS